MNLRGKMAMQDKKMKSLEQQLSSKSDDSQITSREKEEQQKALQELEELREIVKEYERKFDAMQKKYADDIKRITDAKAQENAAAVQPLESRVAELESVLERTKDESRRKALDLKAGLENVYQLETENGELKEGLESAQVQTKDMEKQIEYLKSANEKLLDEATTQKRELEYAQSKYEEAQAQIGQLEQEMNSVAGSYEQQVAEYKAKIQEQADLSLRDMRTQIQLLNVQIRKLKGQQQQQQPSTSDHHDVDSFDNKDREESAEESKSRERVREDIETEEQDQKPKTGHLGKANSRLQQENLSLSVKGNLRVFACALVLGDEKRLVEEELERAKKDCSEQRKLYRRKLKRTLRSVQKLQDDLGASKQEKEEIARLTSGFKSTVQSLEQRLAAQDGLATAYKKTVGELEDHIKDLSRQLEKWAVMSIGKRLYRPAAVGEAKEQNRTSEEIFVQAFGETPISVVHKDSQSPSMSPVGAIFRQQP